MGKAVYVSSSPSFPPLLQMARGSIPDPEMKWIGLKSGPEIGLKSDRARNEMNVMDKKLQAFYSENDYPVPKMSSL